MVLPSQQPNLLVYYTLYAIVSILYKGAYLKSRSNFFYVIPITWPIKRNLQNRYYSNNFSFMHYSCR